MPTARDPLPTAALAVWLAFASACRAPAPRDPDLDALLQTVSYDVSVPPSRPPVAVPEQPVAAPAPSDDPVAEETKTFGRTVADGLKATGGLLLLGTLKLVGAMLGSDDDSDLSTPRGRADRNANDWLKARERWRDGERGF